MKKVYISGGGFAGVEAAIKLQKSGLFDVTLISERDFLYMYPISIWVPVKSIDFEDVKIPLQQIQKKYGFKLIIEKVLNISATENIIILENQTLQYDYLIIASGAGKMQHKGIENTTTICGTPEQAIELRDKLDKLINTGSGKIAIGFGGNPKDKSTVRGGPGFELIFNIHHYLKKIGLREKFELTMFAPMPEPGARMGKNAMKAVYQMFKKYRINNKFGKKINEFQADGIVFEDDSKLISDLMMFIPAGTGSVLLKNSDLELTEAGFVKINQHNQSVKFENVFAIGDAAGYEGPDWIAKQGHIAEIMGSNAAYNIIQMETGSSKRKSYQKHLSILCVMDMGNGAAFVYRDNKREIMIPMPVFGHWMKKAWGVYAKWTKLGLFPKII